MSFRSGFITWSLILLGVSHTVATSSSQQPQRKCLPALNVNYTADISFVGCYTDDEARVLQGGQATPPGGTTPQTCADACGTAGFVYAGVEYSRWV
jgi:beta-D-xylosidase 4